MAQGRREGGKAGEARYQSGYIAACVAVDRLLDYISNAQTTILRARCVPSPGLPDPVLETGRSPSRSTHGAWMRAQDAKKGRVGIEVLEDRVVSGR
jgi:hypothetical protein